MQRPLRPRALLAVLAGIGGLVLVPAALANHPVYVEGNCFGPGAAQRTLVVPGTCGDYDGDGRIGVLEDNDEGDRVFGTINAALGPGLGAAAGTGANQNGRVIIVTSGSFPESVVITSANGNTQLEAAPGVDANIDAIVQGVPGGAARQLLPGIIVNAPANRQVTIRNIMSRNWAIGYQIQGNSFVTLENVKADNNANYGVLVQDQGRVAITGSSVVATGFRVGAGTDFPGTSTPMPGVGVSYEGSASGAVCWSTVTGSFRAGISNTGTRDVIVSHDTVFGNNPDVDGADLKDDCVQKGKRNDDDDDDSVVPFGFGGPLALGFALVLAAASLPLVRRRNPRTA